MFYNTNNAIVLFTWVFLKRPIVCENIFDYLNVSCGGSGTTTVYMELKFIAPSCIVGTLFNCGALNMWTLTYPSLSTIATSISSDYLFWKFMTTLSFFHHFFHHFFFIFQAFYSFCFFLTTPIFFENQTIGTTFVNNTSLCSICIDC